MPKEYRIKPYTLARKLIMDQMKARGIRISSISPKEITKLTRVLVAEWENTGLIKRVHTSPLV